MDDDEIGALPSMNWMPSRIPVQDALVAHFSKDTKVDPDVIPSSYEQRWFPQKDGGLRLLVVFLGQDYDQSLFHIEQGAWDHTSCRVCDERIPPMTLCYVTRKEPYIELCAACYLKHVTDASKPK